MYSRWHNECFRIARRDMSLTVQTLGWGALFTCACLWAGCDDAPASQAAGVAYVSELNSLAELEALSAAELVAGVKYLAPIEGRPALQPLTAQCYLQNMHRYPW